MRLFLSSLVVLFASVFSVYAQAASSKVLLISDIDDTIKASHVLSNLGVVSRFANLSIRFTGMAQLYELISRQTGQKTEVAYLSNAPDEVQFVHQAFLDRGHFPQGELLLREDIFNPNHKFESIVWLVEKHRPNVIIFIGDNGEKDVEIYAQAREFLKNKNIKILTYIHQLYRSRPTFLGDLFGESEVGLKLKEAQTGFVTPVEIAIDLNQENVLDAASTDWMIKNIAPYIANEKFYDLDSIGNITFPSFKKCEDFKWKWQITKELKPLVQKINSACR